MRNKFLSIIGIMLMSSTSLAFAAGPHHHMEDQDPARWHHSDDSPQARYQSMKKEASAAYRDALASCRSMRGREKADCTKEAKHNYQEDLEYAKKMRHE